MLCLYGLLGSRVDDYVCCVLQGSIPMAACASGTCQQGIEKHSTLGEGGCMQET
jgi:hypothetical protein